MKVKVSIAVTENGKNSPEWTLDSDLSGVQTLELLKKELKKTVIEVTYEALKEEQDKGFDPKPSIFVDGNPRKRIHEVDPFGKIDIIARQDVGDILLAIMTAILKRSPIDTGFYYFSNVVFVNNVEVATNKQELINYLAANPTFSNKDQIRFVNITPYARKLERHGTVNGKPNKKPKINKSKNRKLLGSGQVFIPNGVYVLAAKSVQNKYGKNAYISFSFIDGGSIEGLTGPNRTYKTDSGVQSRKGKPYFYPSITVKVIAAASTNVGVPNE